VSSIIYDVAVIGAGINGACCSFELTSAGKNVLLLDAEGIAAGGSGAAGAFISPKFSKGGELKELLHEAFLYSMEFYEKHFPAEFRKTTLVHIAKDDAQEEILREYKQRSPLELLAHEKQERESLSINAGIVDAKPMCEALAKKATFKKEQVDSLLYSDGVWSINDHYRAKAIILATGAYKKIINEPYIKLRGIWGHRIDIQTTTKNPHSLHQFVSISADNNGVVAVGATHNLHYHPQTATEAYDSESGRAELLEKASRTICLENVKILKDYTGLRSGSFDYIPFVGSLVDSKETLQKKEINFYTKKPDFSEYSYYPNLSIINGSGGYGFVLAPYLAKQLSGAILEGREISPRLQSARLFARWAKKL
jgi:tRNA 5-methylaminomethyl-2-thiouridine biosynthesis bifunctional protein